MGTTLFNKKISRTVITALAFLTVIVGALTPLVVNGVVSAQGDNFSWKNHQTIQYSGGDLGSGTMGSAANNNTFSAIVTYQNKCKFTLSLNLQNGSDSTAVSIVNADSIGSGGGLPSCGAVKQDGSPEFPGVIDSYTNKLLTIHGTRPAQNGNTPETTAQKAVAITLHTYSSQNPPANVTFTIKNSGGSVVTTKTPSKTVYDSSNIVYIANMSLDPGTYQVCFSALEKQCKTFTKVKYKSLNISYGSTADDQKVNVTLTVNPTVNGTDTVTVGPFTLTLTDSNGNVTTVQTKSKDITGSGTGGVYTTEFDSSFNNVKPGKYKVCLQNTTVCQNVEKEDGQAANVTLTAGGSDTAAASSSCTTTDGQGNAEDCGDYIDCGDNSGLGWITCSVINWAQHGATVLDHFITDSLDIDVKKVFDVSSCGGDTKDCGAAGYYKAWSSFRIIATAIIIIAGLVMVVSQALGFEFLDAYTVRKVLPRLAIAVIGISLSWPLMKFVVGFFDTVGFDIRELIYAPFSGLQAHVVFNTGLVGVLGAAAGWAILGAASLTFILTGLLAMLVGFLVLVIRQILLIVIIVAAPIAIACYILPGTQKVWKIWSDNFLGLLMMFPIISAFIAIGHVFSALALSGNTITNTPGTATASQIIGIIAYFIPYFLLPLTFRLATGFIGNIAGFVNDRNRGAFDRLKKRRGEATTRNIHDMGTGTRFNNRGLNAMTARASTHNFGLGRRGRASYTDKMNLAAAEFGKSGHGMAVQFNDHALRAKTYGSAAEARARMATDWDMNNDQVEEAIAGARASGGFGASQQVYATKQLAATGTGYDNDAQMYATIARVAGNNQGTAAAMYGDMRSASERAGRSDLKAGFGTGQAYIGRIMAANAQAGKALSADDLQGKTDFSQGSEFSQELAELGVEAARGVDNMSLLRQKPASVQNVMRRLDQSRQFHQRRATDATLSAAQRQYSAQQLGQINAKMDNLQQMSAAGYGPEVNMAAVAGTTTTRPGQRVTDEGNRETSTFLHDREVSGQRTGVSSPSEQQGVTVHEATVDARLAAADQGAAEGYQREHVTRGIDERTRSELGRDTPGPEPPAE